MSSTNPIADNQCRKHRAAFLTAHHIAMGKSLTRCLPFLPFTSKLVVAVTFSCKETVNSGQ